LGKKSTPLSERDANVKFKSDFDFELKAKIIVNLIKEPRPKAEPAKASIAAKTIMKKQIEEQIGHIRMGKPAPYNPCCQCISFRSGRTPKIPCDLRTVGRK
jgi:hypothetical protein